MKRITMKYGQKTNLIQLPMEDFYLLQAFLLEVGVEIRACICDGATGEITAQVRNTYAEWVNLYRNTDVSACDIKRRCEDDLKSGHWRR